MVFTETTRQRGSQICIFYLFKFFFILNLIFQLNLKFPYRYNDHMNDPTQERWYHGNITGVSAEALLSGFC